MNILIGAIIIALGALMVFKTETLVRTFGSIAFFDQYLGTEGGTRLGYKLLGLLVIFIGTLVLTSMIGGFLTWLLSPLLKYQTM